MPPSHNQFSQAEFDKIAPRIARPDNNPSDWRLVHAILRAENGDRSKGMEAGYGVTRDCDDPKKCPLYVSEDKWKGLLNQVGASSHQIRLEEERYTARHEGLSPLGDNGFYSTQFLKEFSAIYSPVGAKNDPEGLNVNHTPNILKFYSQAINDQDNSNPLDLIAPTTQPATSSALSPSGAVQLASVTPSPVLMMESAKVIGQKVVKGARSIAKKLIEFDPIAKVGGGIAEIVGDVLSTAGDIIDIPGNETLRKMKEFGIDPKLRARKFPERDPNFPTHGTPELIEADFESLIRHGPGAVALSPARASLALREAASFIPLGTPLYANRFEAVSSQLYRTPLGSDIQNKMVSMIDTSRPISTTNPYKMVPNDARKLAEGYKEWPTVPIGGVETPLPPNVLAAIKMDREMPVSGSIEQVLNDPASPIKIIQQARIPEKPILKTKTSKLNVMPRGSYRFFASAFDVLEKMGSRVANKNIFLESGELFVREGELLLPEAFVLSQVQRGLYNETRQFVGTHMSGVDRAFERVFGPSTALKSLFEQGKPFKGNPWRDIAPRKLYNITPAQERDLFDWRYFGGDETAVLKQRPKGYVIDPKVKEMAQVLFEGDGATFTGTRGINNLKGIRGDPETGLPADVVYNMHGEPQSVGPATMFQAQQPITPSLQVQTKGKIFEAQYQQYLRTHPAKPITKFEYARRIKHRFSSDPEVKARKFGGINNSRDLDLGALGSPFDAATELGYETNILMTEFRYSSGAVFRAKSREIETQVNTLSDAIMHKLDVMKPGSSGWLEKLNNRVMFRSTEELLDKQVSNMITHVRAFNDATLLNVTSTAASFNQFTQIMSRGGFINFLGAFGRSITGRGLRDGPLKSGSLYQKMMADLMRGSSPINRFSTKVLRAQGFVGVDHMTRTFAAQVGDVYATRLAKTFVKNPSDDGLKQAFQELDIDAAQVLEHADSIRATGELPEFLRLRAMQSFSEKTAGGTSPAQLPLWLLNNSDAARLMFQYNKFLGANASELVRGAARAPRTFPKLTQGGLTGAAGSSSIGRITRGMFFGALGGEITGDAIRWMQFREDPFSFTEKNVTPPLRFAGPYWGRLMQGITFGYATAQANLILSFLPDTTELAVLRRAAGATFGSAAQLAANLARAAGGDPVKLAVQAARRIPIVGGPAAGLARKELEDKKVKGLPKLPGLTKGLPKLPGF